MLNRKEKGIVLGLMVVASLFVLVGKLAYASFETSQTIAAATVVSSKESTSKDHKEYHTEVTYKDTTIPVLSFSDVTVNQGESVNVLNGVTATDNVDGDLTNQVKSNGTVDANIPGVYTVELFVTDKAGNISTASKTITVNASSGESSHSSITNTDNTNTETIDNQNTTNDYAAMTMYINHVAVSYQNGGESNGQNVIDNDSNLLSTWGGSTIQSGSDGLNTHFIGHNTGAFSSLSNVALGGQIVVTDSNGTPTTYTVSSIFQVDDSGYGVSDGVNYWNTITGIDGGERITLQTCITDSTNLIVIAYA